MKAIAYHEYGPPEVLKLEDAGTPVAGEEGVLIRVRAASVNPYDCYFFRGPLLLRLMGAGLLKPKDPRLGVDVAGVVEAVGSKVTRFRAGDEVFGTCKGAYAEVACAAEGDVVSKPANVSFEQAAAVPVAAFTALQGLRDKGRLRPGQKVLVNGAAGGVGTFAVQIAKSWGAEVTGVCRTGSVDLVRSIGADHVVDYTQSDYTKSGRLYDLIFDTAGNRSLSENRRVLGPEGTLVLVGGPRGKWIGPLLSVLQALVMSPFVDQTLTPVMAKRSREDLIVLKDLMAAGKVTPVLDRTYPLDEVPDAMRYLEAGHTRGKVVITM